MQFDRRRIVKRNLFFYATAFALGVTFWAFTREVDGLVTAAAVAAVLLYITGSVLTPQGTGFKQEMFFTGFVAGYVFMEWVIPFLGWFHQMVPWFFPILGFLAFVASSAYTWLYFWVIRYYEKSENGSS